MHSLVTAGFRCIYFSYREHSKEILSHAGVRRCIKCDSNKGCWNSRQRNYRYASTCSHRQQINSEIPFFCGKLTYFIHIFSQEYTVFQDKKRKRKFLLRDKNVNNAAYHKVCFVKEKELAFFVFFCHFCIFCTELS